jgi:hypothetical protein
MKTELFLSRTAMLSTLVAVAAIPFTAFAPVLFAGACSALILVIAMGDYSRRPALPCVPSPVRRSQERLPLAA